MRPARCDTQLELNRFQRGVLKIPTTLLIGVILAALLGAWYGLPAFGSSDFISHGSGETSETEPDVMNENGNSSTFDGLHYAPVSDDDEIVIDDVDFEVVGIDQDNIQLVATITNRSDEHVAHLGTIEFTAISTDGEHEILRRSPWDFLIPPSESVVLGEMIFFSDFDVSELVVDNEPEVEWLEPVVPMDELTVTLSGADHVQADVLADSITHEEDSVEMAVAFESTLPRRNTANVLVVFHDDTGQRVSATDWDFEWDYAWIPEGESVRHITISTDLVPDSADLERTEFHIS